MAGCVLRAKGSGFDAAEFLQSTGFQSSATFEDGFNLVVSTSEELAEQLRDAEEFVRENKTVIEHLRDELGGEAPELDFGVWRNAGPSQSVSFPPSLIEMVGHLGVTLTVSLYQTDAL